MDSRLGCNASLTKQVKIKPRRGPAIENPMNIEAFQNFNRITSVLLEDVQLARSQYQQTPTEYSRRVFVKTLFTYLEGHLYAFKQSVRAFEYALNPYGDIIPHAPNSWIVLFTEEEKAMLEEFTYDMGSGGKARKRLFCPQFEDNVKFLVRVFFSAIELESDIDFRSVGWNQLLEAQRIRNRITHPKTDECLQLSGSDVKTVETGIAWYEETIQHMLDRMEKDSIYAP